MSGEPSPNWDHNQGLLFQALTRAHFNAARAGLAQQGLFHLGSPKILIALMAYSEDGAAAPSQKELADLLHISPATAAASLKSLEKCGYVSRRTDERDSRRNRISITPKGLEAMRISQEVFQSVDEYMFHGFSQQERDQVFRLHQRMLLNLHQIGGGSDFSCPPPKSPERMV